ncbi:hypothetical protein jhhlp_002844 [Lomentospora prolificans]|uniref:Cyclin C-terminal domain-containing protein n=1 Tax=Lomentospora prolificans TaxID=41688 RepID=A0A2N3NF71_9PEZI|nr:hypothetical protein jhhlp_002844 [Lomentospora prolificans]
MDPIEDVRYRQSTQFRIWSYTRSKLAELRSKTNALATTHISNRLAADLADGQTLPDFLTAEEEERLLKFYTVELLRAAEFCALPTEIRATAAVHLRRFYVTNSVMTYSPKDILKTCLFFGSKGEGFYTRLSKFAEKFPDTTAEEVVAGEFLLCQGIRFCFDVRHPFRALEGVVLELRRLYPDESQRSRIDRVHAQTRHILKFSPLITDAYFHYTPSQIMFAAFLMVDRELAQQFIQRSFDYSLENAANAKNGTGVKPDSDAIQALQRKIVQTIESCRELLETEPPERMDSYWDTPGAREDIRPLVKKLRKCRDPDRADLVALQKARREQAVKKERPAKKEDNDVFGPANGAQARETKRRKVSGGLEDPFGPPL